VKTPDIRTARGAGLIPGNQNWGDGIVVIHDPR
jgi:hypothetical protein